MSELTILRAIAEGVTGDALDEVTKLDKYKLYGGDKAKSLSTKLREARAESDTKKRKALYSECLTMAKELKADAARIPNNDFGDWAIDLILKPWWWFVVDVVASVSSGESIAGMSRQQAMSHFDQLIKAIERENK